MSKTPIEPLSAKEKKRDIQIHVVIFAVSVFIAIVSCHFKKVTDVEAVAAVLLIYVFGSLVEFRFGFLRHLSGDTLAERYQHTEERIVKTIKLALDSRELSKSIYQNVILPTEKLVTGDALSDHPALGVLLPRVYAHVGRNLTLATIKGLEVADYLTMLGQLTKEAHSIKATSLLIPKVFNEDEGVKEYVDLQKSLMSKRQLASCQRVFVFDKRFDNQDDWQHVVEMHNPIPVKKIVEEGIDIDSYLDFVIFDDKCVLMSEDLRDLIVKNGIDSSEEMVQRYRTVQPKMSGLYIFESTEVARYVVKFNNLFSAAVHGPSPSPKGG